MKFQLTILFLAISQMAMALPRVARVNTAATSITNSYGANPVISEIVRPKILIIDNRQANEIAVNCSHNFNPGSSGTTNPISSEVSEMSVAGSTALILDNPDINGSCWVRSYNATISSGLIVITVIGEN